MLVSLSLFLAISFHTHPFYTGSDIVFLFAWTPFVLVGAGGAPALDTWFDGPPELVRHARSLRPDTGVPWGLHRHGGHRDRRADRCGGRHRPGGGAGARQADRHLGGGSATTTTTTTTAGATGGSTTTTGVTPKGTAIGPASQVPVGGSAAFNDPKSGDPSLVIQHTAGDFVAFDAICPHAGCTVAYQSSSNIIACPCHGSEFNPQTGAVVQGPATSGLTPINVIKGSNGDLYVV